MQKRETFDPDMAVVSSGLVTMDGPMFSVNQEFFKNSEFFVHPLPLVILNLILIDPVLLQEEA